MALAPHLRTEGLAQLHAGNYDEAVRRFEAALRVIEGIPEPKPDHTTTGGSVTYPVTPGVVSGVVAWLKVAAEPAVARRALIYAVVVGAVLIGINHGDAIVHGEINASRLLRMALTALVPYAVSTASSVGAILASRRAPLPPPS